MARTSLGKSGDDVERFSRVRAPTPDQRRSPEQQRPSFGERLIGG
jgi:hypothetical protein